MISNAKKIFVLAAACSVLGTGAQARLCSIPNAASDVASAKTIIRGTGRGVWPLLDNGTGATRYVIVKVDRVIFGSLKWPYIIANAPCAHGSDQGPMLVFLTGGTLGVYQTVNESGILSAAEKAPVTTSTDPHAAVVAELLEAVKVPALRNESLTQLNSLSPKEATKAAEEAVGDQDPQVRTTANLVLTANGSTDAVRRIVSALQSNEMNVDYPNDWTDLRYSTDIAKLNSIIRQGMAVERLKGDQLKIALPLLKHKNHRVRRSASYALRNSEDRSLIPKMLEALGDSDRDVRYNSMMGICGLSAKPWPCSAAKLFHRNEKESAVASRNAAKAIMSGGR